MSRILDSDYALLLVIPLMALAVLFVDGLTYSHLLVGGGLLLHVGLVLGLVGLVLVAARVIVRAHRARVRLADEAKSGAAIVEVAHALGHHDHVQDVLGKLAEQACAIAALDRAVVFVRVKDDPRAVVVAAGHGVPGDLIGRRFGAHQGAVGQVLATRKPVLVNEYLSLDAPIKHRATTDIHAAGSVPIWCEGKLLGALTAAATDPGQSLGQRELDLLGDLADLGTVALEQAAMRERLEGAVHVGVRALAAAVDARDSYTAEHSEQVVGLARRVGARLGLGERALDELEIGARLHDVGKIAVPDSILRKPGELSQEEWEIMRRHPVSGARLLGSVPGLEAVATIVHSEHERWDGRGYPDGLQGEEIPLASRIIFACDAYHAMVSDRPYRAALGHEAALKELRGGAGGQFDPAVVEALLATVGGAGRASSRTGAGARSR